MAETDLNRGIEKARTTRLPILVFIADPTEKITTQNKFLNNVSINKIIRDFYVSVGLSSKSDYV